MKVKELFNIKGKTAIITGGSKGLGAQCADALAEMGVNLVIAARKIEGCEKICAELEKEYNIQAQPVACDVSKLEDTAKLVDLAMERFGKIDILINNAGTAWGGDTMKHPLEGWQKVLDLNLTGTFFLTGLVATKMKEQGGGKILMMSSTAGLVASRNQSTPSYTATKSALIALTRDLAYKWAPYGIYVNVMAPGYFPTIFAERAFIGDARAAAVAKIPVHRFGGDDDLKGAVVYLCSPASNYVTGQCHVIDGGATL
jgi:gluconate 5-dehydrogenase